MNDEGDGPWSDSSSAITRAGGVSRSVAENSAANANVGSPVTATANSAYTYTHSLGGTDASKFEISSATGQITVKSGTSLDYESKSSYSVTVTIAVAAAGRRGHRPVPGPQRAGQLHRPRHHQRERRERGRHRR